MPRAPEIESDYFEKDALYLILYLMSGIPLSSLCFVIDNEIKGFDEIMSAVGVGMVIQLIFVKLAGNSGRGVNNLFGIARYSFRGFNGIVGLALVTSIATQMIGIAAAIMLNLTGSNSDRLTQALVYVIVWIIAVLVIDTIYRNTVLKRDVDQHID